MKLSDLVTAGYVTSSRSPEEIMSVFAVCAVTAFVMPRVVSPALRAPAFGVNIRVFPARRDLSMSAAGMELSQPSQAESEAMGLRDWPSTVVQGSLTDQCNDGAQRYILEGSGQVSRDGETIDVKVGNLLTVRGDGDLLWEASSDEMVLLTPEYKGPPLLPIAGGIFLAFGVLVAATMSG